MNVSLETNLARIRQHQDDYQPSAKVGETLAGKALLMIVAPPAIGKTTIMRHVAEINQNFGRVSVFTTREQREDDEPSLVRTVPNTVEGTGLILQKIINQELVQFAIHPTQQTIYGTEASDYSAQNNLLATLSGAVTSLRELPFRKTMTIGLMAESSSYEQWFTERYPKDTSERQKRAQEAVLSLTWLLEQPDNEIMWLINRNNQLDQTAQALIQQSAGNIDSDERGRHLAECCITMVQKFV